LWYYNDTEFKEVVFMKMELGAKIDYFGNVYEYIGNESDSDSKMIFQSVNDDSYIILTEKDFIEDDIQIL
jgi:hypothetical protein